MSIYRCGICEGTFDADYDDCEENRSNPCECVCLECYMYSDPEFACFRCCKADREVKYCKTTDQYFHEGCI